MTHQTHIGTFTSGIRICELYADEVQNLYVGRIYEGSRTVGSITAETLDELRKKFEEMG